MNEQDPERQGPAAPLAEDGTHVDTAELNALRGLVPGAYGLSPLQLPPAAWWAIVKRVYVMTGFHNLSLLAAGLAYYAFLAFVPLIACIVLVYGLVGDPVSVTQSFHLLAGVVPADVLNILQRQLMAIVTTRKSTQGWGLLFAILISLYGTTRSAFAAMEALNVIYEEYETRSIFRLALRAGQITAGLVLVGIIGTLSISVFTYAANALPFLIGRGAALAIQIMTWVIAGLFISLTFAMIFRLAPDRRAAKWRWLSVGSVLSTLIWLAITLGFGFYVANITDYNATYGSLAAVVIFLMWLFLSAYAVLLGAELNSEMERQTMMDSTVGPEQPIGLRGAVMADSVVVDNASRILLEKKRRREASNLVKRKA